MIRRTGPGIHGVGGIALADMGARCPGGAALPCYYLTFDGGNDLINLVGINLAPPFTLVAWTKRAVVGASQTLICNAAATARWRVVTDTERLTAPTNTIGTANVGLGWIHRAGVALAAANASVYQNGVDTTVTPTIQSGIQVYTLIGASPGAMWWNGQIAALGIAPAALNIPALWAAGTLHKPLDPTVFTVACWNMRNEAGAGVSLIDESVGGNTGTFLGAGEPAWGGLMSVGGPAGWSDS